MKANAKSASEIASLTAKCRISVSLYALGGGGWLFTSAVLTDEEHRQLAPLYAFVVDVIAYIDNLGSFSEKNLERTYLCFPFMLDWLVECTKTIDFDTMHFASLNQPNWAPKRMHNTGDYT